MMDDKRYTIDGQPASAREIIREASILCEEFAKGWMKTTSEAAYILRKNGHDVGDNIEHKEGLA